MTEAIGETTGTTGGTIARTTGKTDETAAPDRAEPPAGGPLCAYDPSSRWRFNLGGGVDDPWSRDLSPGMRSRNFSVFANAKRYFFKRALSIGLELMYMHTEFIDRATGTAIRVQGQGRFDF